MNNFNQYISDFKKLISYKSVKAPKVLDKPFGEGVYGAFKFFLDLAKSFGFETINYDNYMGEIIFGEGEEIGIIGHLDVVPEGEGWVTPPFTLTKIDGTYYARGVSDDKSACLLILYILKELKDSGIKVNKKFRFFVGCDEESGWADVDYFKTKSSFPEYGFSPDGDFPVSYAEKGINEIVFSIPKLKNFSSLTGGTVFNAVCGYATVKAEKEGICQELLDKHHLKLLDNGIIESVGKACHGSRPQCGINALKALFCYFLDMGEDVKNVVDYLFLDKAEISKIKTEQGYVTFSPDIAREESGRIYLHSDLRIPAPKKLEDIIPIFDSFNIDYVANKKRDPMLVDKDGEFVQTLLSAYNSVTGEKGLPVSQSGGTFAYVFDKGCAFGPEFPNKNSSIHEPNECIEEKDLLLLYEIYKKAIFDLAK